MGGDRLRLIILERQKTLQTCILGTASLALLDTRYHLFAVLDLYATVRLSLYLYFYFFFIFFPPLSSIYYLPPKEFSAHNIESIFG